MFFTLLLTTVTAFQPGTPPAVQPAAPAPAVSLRPPRPSLQLRQYGLQVTQVIRGGTAWRQGIKPGDIILSVNREPVRSLADLQLALSRTGRVAQLQVIDCNTGYPDQVNVYPTAGRIASSLNRFPLDQLIPGCRRFRTRLAVPWEGPRPSKATPLPSISGGRHTGSTGTGCGGLPAPFRPRFTNNIGQASSGRL